MSSALSIARSVLGVIVGYPTMGLLITLVQETWLGGVSFTGSTLGVLLVAGFFTFLSAAAGGWLAAWISRYHPLHCGAAMSLLVMFETTWLITTGRTSDPVWFDVTAAASLVAGILLGAGLYACRSSLHRQVAT